MRRNQAIVSSSGWTIAQATPSAVCLYRTFTSREARKPSRSRYCQSSRRLTPIQPGRACTRTTGNREGAGGDPCAGAAACGFARCSTTVPVVVTPALICFTPGPVVGLRAQLQHFRTRLTLGRADQRFGHVVPRPGPQGLRDALQDAPV